MVNVIISDQSYLVASSLTKLLKEDKKVNEVKVADNGQSCLELIKRFEPHIIFINASLLSVEQYEEFKELVKKDVVVQYLFYSILPDDAPASQFSVLASKAAIMDRLQKLITDVCKNSDGDSSEELSPREKSILKCVALGLTNKEIAEKEFISTHTVISHRKNITRKLGIKTVSGLTVYAIINNIIQMNDIT